MGKITARQIEAYKFVYIYECKHEEAARLMECGRSNVTHLLLRLKKIRPYIFPPKRHIRIETHTGTHGNQAIKTETYTGTHDSQAVIKF